MVASGPPTAAPKQPPPPAGRQRPAGRRRGTVASRPLAAALHRRPLTATCGTTGVAAPTLLRGSGAVQWRAPPPPPPPTQPPPAGRQRGRCCRAAARNFGEPPPGRPPKLLAAHHDLLYWAAARTLLLGGPTGAAAPARAPAVTAGLLIKRHQDSRPRLCSDWEYMVAGQANCVSSLNMIQGQKMRFQHN